jgi:hypothetical protein
MFVVLAITSRVIASEARQSLSPTVIASAGFASLAMTERKCHSGTE